MCWASKTPCSYDRNLKSEKFLWMNMVFRDENKNILINIFLLLIRIVDYKQKKIFFLKKFQNQSLNIVDIGA